tara:strand:+ start:392 stop:1801 length:1410 start_codon:yes stop_codon:yes gene_type:complete
LLDFKIPNPLIINEKYLTKYFEYFDYIFKEKNDIKVLLAFSGGSDSMLLLYLFLRYFEKKNNQTIKIAHINHNIRNDSYKDEAFATKVGLELGIDTYLRQLNPKLKSNNDSIESWARKERYKLLSEILIESNSNIILTGHHKNDQAETILKNISESTGLFGLGGMKSINKNLIRPLLPFTKLEILSVIDRYKIPYVDDSSNNELTFKRNFIRKKVLAPWVLNDNKVIDSIAESGAYFSEYQKSLIYFVNEFIKNNALDLPNGQVLFKKKHINKLPILARVIVFQVLTNALGQFRKYDFQDIKNFMQKNTTGSFYTSRFGWCLLVDRKCYILSKENGARKNNTIDIALGKTTKFLEYDYTCKEINSGFEKSENPNVEYIDQRKIKNKKLQLRVWKKGDSFRPLGMSGKQKISDFLINKKLNRFEKFNQSVLCADGKIIWLCGHRIDDRYKIRNETTKFVSLNRSKRFSTK